MKNQKQERKKNCKKNLIVTWGKANSMKTLKQHGGCGTQKFCHVREEIWTWRAKDEFAQNSGNFVVEQDLKNFTNEFVSFENFHKSSVIFDKSFASIETFCKDTKII